MTSTTYLSITIQPIKMFQEHPSCIYISSSLLSYWGIRNSEQIILCIGTTMQPVMIMKKEIEKDHLLLDEEIMAKIPLPMKKIRFLCQYDQENKTLYIGPIIAVATEVYEQEDGLPSFRSIHSFCEELHYFSESTGGFFFIFHPKDFTEDKIIGWHYEEDGWRKATLTLPNVIYNRVHSRKIEASLFFDNFKQKISAKKIPLFNDRFLTKWDVHNILHAEEHLQPYLPKTDLYSKESLSSLLDKYSSVYLKPINGSQGRNIYRVSTNEHVIVESSSIREKNKEFLHLHDFHDWFHSRSKQYIFIIQQTIPLITYQDRQLDFRVLCHKNHQHQWRITSIVSRISAVHQFVSNLARGGDLFKPEKALMEHFDPQTLQAQLALMKELSLEVAHVISQASDGYVGELGIDMGIDSSGNPWLIEVNSKPSKNTEEQKQNIRPSTKAIYEYAHTLAFQHLRETVIGEKYLKENLERGKNDAYTRVHDLES